MNTEFKHRLNDAIAILRTEMRLLEPKSQKLFTPIYENRKYRWSYVMGTDGILAAEQTVAEGEEKVPGKERPLCIGVIIQSEFSTSGTKPNPFGKAAIARVPLGIWFDKKDGSRVRMDRVHVLFVLPESALPKDKEKFITAKRNVQNATSAMPDVEILEIKKGWKAKDVVPHLKKRVRKWLKGVGRPKAK